MKLNKTFWINNEFIKRGIFVESFSDSSAELIQRAYELWNHAKDILESHSTKDFLSDAISNLNKVIGLRIKLLNDIYHFNQSPFKTRDKKIYNQLGEFEILRPKLINEITTFRNKIEHHDETPPTLNKCKDFIEICWYFLKATDLPILHINDSILFCYDGQDPYGIGIEINFKNKWEISISGCVKPSQLVSFKTQGFIEINLDRHETAEQLFNRLSKGKGSSKAFYKEREINQEDIFINGILLPNKDEFKEIVRKYFKAI